MSHVLQGCSCYISPGQFQDKGLPGLRIAAGLHYQEHCVQHVAINP